VLSVDVTEFKRLVRELETARKTALPYASREYVNSAAFLARDHWIARAQSSMVLRTQWTKRSIQVDKARSLTTANQVSKVGSVAGYMLTQEQGATQGKHGKHGAPIPAASPGKRRGRRGKVATGNRLAAIALKGKGVSGSRQRRNAVAIHLAAKAGGGFVYLDLRGRRGIYRVSGTKRGIRIRKVWDLSKASVNIPRNHMLEESLREIREQLPALAVKAVLFQLKRHKVLGY
jgi:hypothetical protein